MIGPRTMDELEDSLGALRIQLSKDELQAIDDVAPPSESVSRTTRPIRALTFTACNEPRPTPFHARSASSLPGGRRIEVGDRHPTVGGSQSAPVE